MNYLAGFALFVACINEMQAPCDLPVRWWEFGQEKTDVHVHGIPPRYNTGTKLSAKIQLPPSGTWGQVFSTHVLEPDCQCTCFVHVSFQALRPDLRLHARVKKKSAPAIMCVCECVHTHTCFLSWRNLWAHLPWWTWRTSCVLFYKRVDKSAGGVK